MSFKLSGSKKIGSKHPIAKVIGGKESKGKYLYLEDFKFTLGDCPVDVLSEMSEKQKNQLDGLAWRGMATPAVKRKRRVLKPLKKEPAVDETASWETVSVDEGNCPSDGCSFEAALPFDENKYARGYQASKHSSEDARARLAIQVETLRAQREADLQAKAAVLAEIERADLVANAARRGEQLRSGILALGSDLIVEVRGRGLLLGIELDLDWPDEQLD